MQLKGGSIPLLIAAMFFLHSAAVFAQDETNLELKAEWKPFADSKYQFAKMWKTLQQLKPSKLTQSYTQHELSIFLPPENAELGDVWKIDVQKIIPFIKQFHPGATHELHHGGPQGAFGTIAATNELFIRVKTRSHGEINLKDGIYLPSQFAGDVVIDRSTNRIVAFTLAVPPRRNNVDLNWDREPEEGEMWSDADGNLIPAKRTSIADIGYCEKMELRGGDWETVNKVVWEEELSLRKIEKSFQRKFYRWASIDWLPWEEAVAKSQATGKPLHVVALFGVLDDESC